MVARLIVLAVLAVPQAAKTIDCVADVSHAADAVIGALATAHMAADWCKDDMDESCANIVSGAVGCVGYAITEASKVEQDCHDKLTECGQDLGSVVSAVGMTGQEAFSAVVGCSEGGLVDCALGSLLPVLQSFEVAQDVEHSLRSCVHKLPHNFDCVADAAVSLHGLVATASHAIMSAGTCKEGQQGCGYLVGSTLSSVGFTAVKISEALRICRGKNTACAGELGHSVESLGQAGAGLMRARQACTKMGVGCVVMMARSGVAVLDYASKISSAIGACHKSNITTAVV